jgi:hypothetical protein
MHRLKKNSAGLLEVPIHVEDSWRLDAERIIDCGELPVRVKFLWVKAPIGWNPFESEISRGQILKELNQTFEYKGFPGRARTLTTDRVCEITELSIHDLMVDKDGY